jgi:hypothetical protein
MSDKPTVGRIVHVFDKRFDNGARPLAAIVCAVLDEAATRINATVHSPTGGTLAAVNVAPKVEGVDFETCVWAWPERA